MVSREDRANGKEARTGRLHLALVHELFRDLPASSTVFRGRPLNALTWPELLRHYIEMLIMEHEDEGLGRLSSHMKLDELCDALQSQFYEDLPFKTKVLLLLTNFDLAIETVRFRQYVDLKLDMFEAVQAEKRLEFERLRKVLAEHQTQLKADKQNLNKSPVNMPQNASPAPAAHAADASPAAQGSRPVGHHSQIVTKQLNQEWRRESVAGGADAANDMGGGGLSVAAVGAGEAVMGNVPAGSRPNGNGFALFDEHSFALNSSSGRPIPQMDGADASEDDDTGGGMEVDEDEDDDEDGSRHEATHVRDAGSDEYDSADGSDYMDAEAGAFRGQDGDEGADQVDDEDDADVDQMSEDDENSDSQGRAGAHGAADRPGAGRTAGAGKGVLTKPPSAQGAGAQWSSGDEAAHVRTSDNSAYLQEFRKAWIDLTKILEYDAQEVRIKSADGEESFGVHELYWSVQSFGGSVKLEKWKMAANDMVTRRTGRPCVPVPGRGYGYIPKAWERWGLGEFERRYGASNVPPEYAKPAFVATRRAMLLAAGLPLAGRRKQGGDLAADKAEPHKAARKASGAKTGDTAAPKAPRSRASEGASRGRPRSGGGRSRPRASGGRAPILADGSGTGSSAAPAGVPHMASPEVGFLLKLLESKTVVRGLSKEEMVVKRAIDRKHKTRLSQVAVLLFYSSIPPLLLLYSSFSQQPGSDSSCAYGVVQARFKTEPLGADRYRRQYWVLGNDFSVIWVENHNSAESDAAPTGAPAAAAASNLCQRMRRQFSVMSSAEQVNKLLKALDSHGIRENELLENIAYFRHELSEAMGSPIASVLAQPGDKDASTSSAVANTLASIALASHDAPAASAVEDKPVQQVGPASSHETAALTPSQIGHWEKTSDGNRVWVARAAAAPSQAAGQPLSASAACPPAEDAGIRDNARSAQHAAFVSNAARYLEATQPVGKQSPSAGSNDHLCSFSQRLYAKSAAREVAPFPRASCLDGRVLCALLSGVLVLSQSRACSRASLVCSRVLTCLGGLSLQIVAAQEYFGILEDHHSSDAAGMELPYSMCKVKGDLLLIEMAVHEVRARMQQAFGCCGSAALLMLLARLGS